MQIGLSMHKMDLFYSENLGNNHRTWIMVMQAWLEGEGSAIYPQTWEGLFELLDDIDCHQVAHELKTALHEIS